MNFSQAQDIKSVASSILSEEKLDEAYHEKDRDAVKELNDYFLHHSLMRQKHEDVSRGVAKNKELTKHDLAIIAHKFALEHFGNLKGTGYGRNALPEDYHQDREFYDKLNGSVSKRADGKSKECGVDIDTV